MDQIIIGTQDPRDIPVFTSGSAYFDNGNLYEMVDDFSLVIRNEGEWNQSGYKNITVNSDSTYVYVDNFVDVTVSGDYDRLYLNYAKRGDIEAHELTFITPYSNGGAWSNMFDVQGDDSANVLTFTRGFTGLEDGWHSDYDSTTSQWTEFVVDLAAGDDVFVYDIDPSANSQQVRSVDGGSGWDVLKLQGDSDDLSFSNIEYVETFDNTLFIDNNVLANNVAQSWGGLVVNGNVAVTSEVDTMQVSSLSDDAIEAIDQYFYATANHEYTPNASTEGVHPSLVTLTIGEKSYTLLLDTDKLDIASDNVIYRESGTIDQDREFNLELGSDDDTFVYDLEVSWYEDPSDAAQYVHHYLDGGEQQGDFDQLLIEQDPQVLEFSNFEYVEYAGELEFTTQTLASNGSDLGLIVNGQVNFSDAIDDLQVNELSSAEQQWLEDVGHYDDNMSELVLTIDDSSYTLLMNNEDFSYGVTV